MNTRIIRRMWLIGLLSANIGIAPHSDGKDLSKLIVGRWQNLDAQPARFTKFLPDGTWQLVYSGRSDIQSGKWRIEGRTLVRTYDTGEERHSEILRLSTSGEPPSMVLRTQMTNPNTGQLVKHTDHYRGVADQTVKITDGTGPDEKKFEVWITGDVLTSDKNQLLFRADKPVQGNNTGNLVLLGATKQAMNVLLPMYMKAAEKHAKLRLYGYLVPDPRVKDPNSPSVQFITWKAHLPNEPDELPAEQKMQIGPNDKVPGYKIEAPGYKSEDQEKP